MPTLKEILQAIGRRHGVESLNPMQRAVAEAKASRIVLLAPTGSGKTLAFTVPMIESLAPASGRVQAVVIAPARELVLQIADVIRPVAEGYKTVTLYGGHSALDEANSLAAGADIVVATPGRLLDHILRENIDIRTASTLVIDEYDKQLELGFHDQMRRICRRIPRVRRLLLTSATPLAERPDFIDLSQAKVIDFSERAAAPRSRMKIALVKSPSRDKLEALADLLHALPDGRTIVFVNHRESADRVHAYLVRQHFPAGLYHGGLDQMDRELAVDMLNNGTTPILVSTDLGSRGLDIDAVRSVVHYHIPPTAEAWTHRNGRTARVDATGEIYILASEGESLPEYVDYDFEFVPDPDTNPDPIRSDTATLYIAAGKKEKLSKADILGFLTKQCGLDGKAVGRIAVKDHCAIAAIPRASAPSVTAAFAASKIKGRRIRASIYK